MIAHLFGSCSGQIGHRQIAGHQGGLNLGPQDDVHVIDSSSASTLMKLGFTRFTARQRSVASTLRS
jgi:hypothetical protein